VGLYEGRKGSVSWLWLEKEKDSCFVSQGEDNVRYKKKHECYCEAHGYRGLPAALSYESQTSK
jgi:hypothetical protein